MKRFFLTYVYTVDQCSFNTNHKIKLVAFEDGVSKKRSIVGAYGIPLVTSTSCRYEMSIVSLSDYALEINSPGHYGRDEDGYKGVFKRDSL